MLKEFKASSSSFWGTNNKRAEYGDWFAPYYNYVTLGNKVWLIVGDENIVSIDGKTFDLKVREPLINVKGLVGLEKPGTYKLWYKSLY